MDARKCIVTVSAATPRALTHRVDQDDLAKRRALAQGMRC